MDETHHSYASDQTRLQHLSPSHRDTLLAAKLGRFMLSPELAFPVSPVEDQRCPLFLLREGRHGTAGWHSLGCNPRRLLPDFLLCLRGKFPSSDPPLCFVGLLLAPVLGLVA